VDGVAAVDDAVGGPAAPYGSTEDVAMTTIVLGPRPPELEAFLERRRRLGQDRHDEVWEGRYVVAPFAHSSHGIVQAEIAAALRGPARAAGLVVTVGFNLGVPDDFRVPDGGLHRTPPGTLYVDTAQLVVEVLSPDDQTFSKLDFYAAHGVRELLVADYEERSVRCFALQHGHEERRTSEVVPLAMTDLQAQIDWPS
jgi:Uma2 family endonuclease